MSITRPVAGILQSLCLARRNRCLVAVVVTVVALLAIYARAAGPGDQARQAIDDTAPGWQARTSVLVHLVPGAERGALRRFTASNRGLVKYEYRLLPNVVNVRGVPQHRRPRYDRIWGQ